MTNTTILFCLIHDDDPTQCAFPIKVSTTDTVGDLKELIKAKKAPRFNDIAPDELTLWRVNIPQDELATLDPKTDVQELSDKLSPLDEIQDIYPEGVRRKYLHIITVRPAIVASNSNIQNITPSNSTQKIKPQGKYTYQIIFLVCVI